MTQEWKPKRHAYEPPDVTEEVVYAVRALAENQALPHQQRLIWDWLMYVTAAAPEFADLSFRPGPDGQRETDFAEGKRFVGLQIRKMLHPAMTPPKTPAAPPAPTVRRR